VSEGLVAIDGIAAQIAAAGSDTGKAKPLADQIEPRWSKIEDTVRANSKDAYVALEDAFAVLEDASRSGDAAAAAKGARSVSDAVRTYVARYQG
jgi:hypothetical protein